MLHDAFRLYVEPLHSSFERLVSMVPTSIEALRKPVPQACIYLFSEDGRHLYVGRTRHFRNRLRQHSIFSAKQNQAVFAFRLASEKTGRIKASYTTEDSRAARISEPDFAAAFAEAKARIRKMELRFVEETDPLRQALLEIYVSVVLRTPYNDFNTH